MSLLEKAIAIAVEAHKGQKDRYGQPYILHPLRVMFRVQEEQERIVAILHDVVEDCGEEWPFDRLRREGFPEPLLVALECVMRKQNETYEAFVQRSHPTQLPAR